MSVRLTGSEGKESYISDDKDKSHDTVEQDCTKDHTRLRIISELHRPSASKK